MPSSTPVVAVAREEQVIESSHESTADISLEPKADMSHEPHEQTANGSVDWTSRLPNVSKSMGKVLTYCHDSVFCHHTHNATLEAFEELGLANQSWHWRGRPKHLAMSVSAVHADVKALMRLMIGRDPTDDEHDDVLEHATTLQRSGAFGDAKDGHLTAAALSTAMRHSSRRSRQGTSENLTVLRRRERFFAIVHGGRRRMQVLAQMTGHVKAFAWLLALLVLPLAITCVAVAVFENTRVGLLSEAVCIGVCAGIAAVIAVLGFIGAARLRRDLRTHDDGQTTTAQRIIEAYFWSTSLLAVSLLAAAIATFALPNASADRIATLATSDVGKFAQLADTHGLSLGGDDDVRAVTDAALRLQHVIFGLALALALALIVTNVVAAKIVTVFEIVQGMCAPPPVMCLRCGLWAAGCGPWAVWAVGRVGPWAVWAGGRLARDLI